LERRARADYRGSANRQRGATMKLSLNCSLAMLTLASSLAHADGSGTLYQDGKALTLVSAYAYRGPDPFDKTKEITTVVFSDKKIDAAAVNAAADRGEAVEDQLRRQNATRLELNIEDDGSLQNVNVVSGGSSGSQSGSGWYTMKLAHHDAKRVEGSFHTNDEADKKSGRYYDLKFALDLAGPPDLGAALPAGGGEPAKAYMAYLAALKKGDVDALAKTMTHERSAEVLAHRNDPDFKVMFGFIQQSAMRDPKVTKGFSHGDTATLELSGKDGDGNAATSTATMQKEAGSWRLAKESMSSHVQ
jgi:ketosteroid isomerase-like protein